MKVLGLLIAVLGWLIAVSSVELSGVVVQTFVAVFGLLVALGGVLGRSQRRSSEERHLEKLNLGSREGFQGDIGETCE